ncbi:MAG: hypothetical protein COU81_01850 [Candidatus Portnoybacteria bacterium CG10_big_fil_rev_8_21_14_0_10_36_7]|uniref:Nudix hydrolase domain-containing protein n=1 Tax=Candidatus Portnoybacteria bacterium CG10_big_fil_rev_8_21_14_0_10_36_7 TaxID=1974812 RepID=A0A2M8KEA6_9BACT|nr:MAG: hypothetical protein COU81_01850 [Candidatus Portnoybacteria bacterium CG10_big_fil_rev_8_21_14_0_10_36_7]
MPKNEQEDVDLNDVEVLMQFPGRDKGDGTKFDYSLITGHKEAGETIRETIEREPQEEADVEVEIDFYTRPEEPVLLFEPKQKIGSKKHDNVIAGYICFAKSLRRDTTRSEAKSVLVRVGEVLRLEIDDFSRAMLNYFVDNFSEIVSEMKPSVIEKLWLRPVSSFFKKK